MEEEATFIFLLFMDTSQAFTGKLYILGQCCPEPLYVDKFQPVSSH